jgi:hypothetical protein
LGQQRAAWGKSIGISQHTVLIEEAYQSVAQLVIRPSKFRAAFKASLYAKFEIDPQEDHANLSIC